MAFSSLRLSAVAIAGLLIAAPAAQAGGLYDADDGYSGTYNSQQNLDAYCDRNPHDSACDGYDEPQYKPHYKQHYEPQYRPRPTYKQKSYYSGRCKPLVRASGKRNLVTAFARNSARFAWRREARAVHGSQYADWRNARNAQITCTRYGGLKSCTARGTPCAAY